jgi:two-component system, chemotaxis family, chemotaxis protein CheY
LPKRILVVEDDPDARNLIETILKQSGYDVVLAADGREGFEKAAEEAPDLIITDIAMPRLDGLRLIQLLRTMPAFRYLPILAITSFGTERASEALKAGANDALARPVRNEFLLQSVKSLIPDEKHLSVGRSGPNKTPGPTH